MTSIIKNNKFNYIVIKNNNFEVTLCDLGASIYSIKYGDDFLTLTPCKKDFENSKYYNGKTIGRSANRHKGNIFTIGNNDYIVDINENSNILHGGTNGLSTKVFTYEIKEYNDKAVVKFSYTSPKGESGFPGNLLVNITYTISFTSCEVLCEFNAKTDKLTICALTNHSSFILGESNLNNLKLKIKGGRYLVTNPIDLLPLEIKDVPSYLDFRKLKKVVQDIDNVSLQQGKLQGYDHFFYFDKLNDNPQVLLEGEKYKLTISSDFEGVQVYSDSWEDEYSYYNVFGKCRRGVALEAQDSFLVHTTLEPNEIYKHYIKYSFQKI